MRHWIGYAMFATLVAAAAPAWPQAGFDESASARLLMAARANDIPAVERALAEGGSIDSRNRIGETALLVH